MPRKLRRDAPGTWHHVANRCAPNRPLFESQADARYFLSRIARLVRKKVIRVHAFCVSRDSYHLLIESMTGDLPSAMRWCQELYSRWANHRRGRDGSLFRGRYRSALLESEAHKVAVLRYIDLEAGGDGMDPFDASLFYYRARRSPKWLTRGFVESVLETHVRQPMYDPGEYDRLFANGTGVGLRYVVDQRLERALGVVDPLDGLLIAADSDLLQWLLRASPESRCTVRVIVSPICLRELIERERSAEPDRKIKLGRKRRPFWDILEGGLMRSMSGMSYEEIGRRFAVSAQAARGRIGEHHRALMHQDGYPEAALAVVRAALQREHPVILDRLAPRLDLAVDQVE